MSGEPETVAGRPVSVSVVMPSGHTHTLSHVFDYDSPQAWDCGTVGISVTDGHLVTVDFRALSEARSAARAEAFAEIRRGVEGLANVGTSFRPAVDRARSRRLLRRHGWQQGQNGGRIKRWLLLWHLYGLPRCSQAVPPDLLGVPHCWRLIWPWQEREIRNGAPVHVRCLR